MQWTEFLDRLVARKTELPSHVRVLRIPLIDGWEPGRVWSAWEVDPELIQPHGDVFGGYIAAVADEMLGMATMSVLAEGEVFTTSESSLHYFRPIRAGTLRVEASVLHRGRSSAHVEVAFTNREGEPVAKARGTQIIRRPAAS
jgi:uncharacterized protein (TIGR00369 family)